MVNGFQCRALASDAPSRFWSQLTGANYVQHNPGYESRHIKITNLRNVQPGSGAHPAPYSMGTEGGMSPLSAVKTDRSWSWPSPYSAENECVVLCFNSLHTSSWPIQGQINPLNAELNPILHLLALLGSRHIVHVSRIRVKSHLPLASIGRSSPYCPR